MPPKIINTREQFWTEYLFGDGLIPFSLCPLLTGVTRQRLYELWGVKLTAVYVFGWRFIVTREILEWIREHPHDGSDRAAGIDKPASSAAFAPSVKPLTKVEQ